MNTFRGLRYAIKVTFCVAIAVCTITPASATIIASAGVCLGLDCSGMGDIPPYVSSAFADLHRTIDSGVPSQPGRFDGSASSNVSPRSMGFSGGFFGSHLRPETFTTTSPEHPGGTPGVIAASGFSEDTLTISAPGLSTGFVSFKIGVHGGGVNGCTAVPGCSATLPEVRPSVFAQFNFQANGNNLAFDSFSTDMLTAVGGVSRLYDTTSIPFVSGDPFSVSFSANGRISLDSLLLNPNPPEQFIAGGSIDFGHTFLIESVQVFDQNHQLLTDYTIQSESGSDWKIDLTDLPGTPDVPEPGTWTLAFIGLCVVGIIMRERVAPSSDCLTRLLANKTSQSSQLGSK